MKQYNIYETKSLYVTLSTDIRNQIDGIVECNQENLDAIQKWFDYIDGIKQFISNPSIALDYDGKHRVRNGTIFRSDFGYNVGFSIKITKHTNIVYVYIYMMNLNPSEFGLKTPSSNNESLRRYIGITQYINEQKYQTTYKMKSLVQYIQEKNEPSYNIGDIYYEDGQSVGIVVFTKDNGKHAIVMSLSSFDENGNPKDTEQELHWNEAVKGVKQYRNGKWHLPSVPELKTMYKNFDKIQSILKSTKNARPLKERNGYFSSTEYSDEKVYYLDVYDGNEKWNYKNRIGFVRAFLSI